ncbi:MAG: DNA polymerase III subunit chi, partial [Steroidobacteraceae bacterium]
MPAPRIDFYTLSEPDRRARLVAACRLAEKACDQGLRVAVRTGSAAETAELDELLWTFADRSFVPHGVWPTDPETAGATPVLVGSSALPATHRDVLI